MDVENLIPGSPAWEREIERAIRSAAGIIVLLSPDSNNSEWVRREVSFAEQNNKRTFPVLIRGDEDDSIPLRLSSHQRVDLRRNMANGLDELANALKDHLGVTAIHQRPKQRVGEKRRGCRGHTSGRMQQYAGTNGATGTCYCCRSLERYPNRTGRRTRTQ